MSKHGEHEILRSEILLSIDWILGTDQIDDEEKTRLFRQALQILENEDEEALAR